MLETVLVDPVTSMDDETNADINPPTMVSENQSSAMPTATVCGIVVAALFFCNWMAIHYWAASSSSPAYSQQQQAQTVRMSGRMNRGGTAV